MVRPIVPSLLEPIQLAHSPGGTERALHILQATLEKESYSLVSSEFPQVSAVAIMDDVEFVGPFS